MTLAKYISDLLYRYECVIVPNFGGFVTNEISAKINHSTHTFYPPSNQLTFNSHLQNNDGLLANYLATSENISYSVAVSIIEKVVKKWKQLLIKEELELENIGTFSQNQEGKFIFEPNSSSVNYLTKSYGLSTYASPEIKRIAYKENVRQLETIAPILSSEENKHKTPVFIKYAATAAIIIALSTVGWNQYQKIEYNRLVAKAKQEQQNLEKTIQEATFVISNPLPTITLNVSKETGNYHIIAGAFRNAENAERKLQQLLDKGYNAKILGVNKWNLTPVAYGSFNSENEAVNTLNAIKETESSNAWLLIDEQQKAENNIQKVISESSIQLPTTSLNIPKETYNYHIIAGAFRNVENAEKKLQQLLQEGFNARVLSVNKRNLTPVAYESFNSKNEAINKLNSIRKSESKDAWLLIKEY